jgi:hypothetical protein
MKYNLFLILIYLFCTHYHIMPTGEMKVRLSNFDQEKTITIKNPQAYYFNGADFIIESSDRNIENRLASEKNLKLRTGSKTVFFFHALHVPTPEKLGGFMNNYYLFIEKDSFSMNDTIVIGTDLINALFYYDSSKDVSFSSGHSTDLQGYMIINQVIGDTLCGVIHFEGETREYSASTEISNIKTYGYVSCQIEFRAIKKKLKGDSEIIATFLVPPDVQIDFGQ